MSFSRDGRYEFHCKPGLGGCVLVSTSIPSSSDNVQGRSTSGRSRWTKSSPLTANKADGVGQGSAHRKSEFRDSSVPQVDGWRPPTGGCGRLRLPGVVQLQSEAEGSLSEWTWAFIRRCVHLFSTLSVFQALTCRTLEPRLLVCEHAVIIACTDQVSYTLVEIVDGKGKVTLCISPGA